MKNFLQVNRALAAEKNYLLFNQSFGTEGSPNQTGETLTRENRIGLMSYLHRTLMLLFAVLVMSMANIGMAWGAETSMPTSGSYSTNTKYAFSNSAVTGSSFYLAQRGSIGISSNYGWRPYNTGIALQVSSPVSLTFTIKSNTTSSRTISGQAYAVTDPFFNIYKNTTAGSQTLEDYVRAVNAKSAGSRSSEEAAIAAVSAFAAITGSADANKKLLICENPGAFSEAVAHGAAISHACPTTKGATNTFTVNLSAAGKYVIYLTSSNGDVGITKINIVPRKTIYMVPGNWNNDTPKFYVHSWGDFNDDVLMTVANCETNVFRADVPTNNTNLLFTRQNPSSTEIKYKDQDGNWNQSANYSIGSNNQFTFSGTWSDGEGKSTFNAGTYSAPTFTVTYDANGGTGSVPVDGSSPYSCGSNVTILGNTGSLAKAGKAFDGWNTDSGGGGTSYTEGSILSNITGDVTLFAKWVTAYSVTYNANGGSGSVPSDATPYVNGATVTVLGRNTLTKSDYVFAGWNTKSDGSGTWYIPTETFSMGTKDVTLYAQWATCISTTDFAALSDAMGTRNLANTKSSLTDNNIKHSLGGDTRYDNSSGYHGLKLKHTGDWIGFGVAAGNTVTIKTETVGASPEVTIDFESAATLPANTDKAYEESGSARYFRIKSTDGSKAVVINKITIGTASCTAPSALAAASPTAKGITLSVTDANDVNNYEFYVSTESTAPEAGATATHSVSSNKSLTITNLVAGTTYYAWARSVCGVSNKSAWTALGDGGTFTTSTVTVTHTLTNVTKTSGATTAGGSDYTAEFAAVSGYSMPTPTVTIDGNTATSGTDYTWTAGTGTISIPANKINGNIVITLNSAAAAPSSVAITGNWLYFAGETIELTATPTGGNGPVTYQWYKGGKENGNAIEGATTATYTKATCAFDDAGSYYCKVTCGGSQSTWGQSGDAYNVKIPRLYVKTGRNDGVKSDFGNVDFTRATASTATASIVLGSNWDYCFNIADGCGQYYGNAGTMQYNNYGPWTTNVNNQDCGLRTTNGATYVFTIDYSNWAELKTTVTFPVANQAAGKVIYFDNNVLKWTGSSIYYRIGHSSHSQADQLSLVPGTANLYKMTTREYNGFSGWHIANATGDVGSGKSIYKTVDGTPITKATAHEGASVTATAVTVTPTSSKGMGSDAGVNDNCEFYNYTITDGMKTDRVTITEPSNGTLTVNYVDVSGAAQAFSSGNRDLAHTCIITVTAVPAAGYAEPATVSINGASHGNRDPYTITGTTVVAATFSPASYTVTLNTNGGTINAGNVTSYTYGTGATLPTNVTKSGFTFGGWYDNEGLTGSAVTTISTTATGNKTYWAKWTAAASLTALECNTLYKVEDMVPASITLTGDGQYGAGLSANTKFEVIGNPAEAGNAGGTPEMKNEAASFAEQSFTARMYLKGASNTTGSGTTFVPTSRAVKFIVSESGTLDIYAHRVDRLYLKKAGDSGTTQLGTSTSGSGSMVSHNVTAGTYYIYSVNNGTCIYGIKLNCCSDPVINEGTTKTSFAGGSWPQNSGHTITITATGADSYEWYRNTSATDAGATKLSETSNTLDITADVAAGTYFYKAIAKSGACSSSTEWGWCGAMTITAVTYSITYNCNGAESGCPSNVAAASNLPNPLPTGLTKDGYDFGGWFTDSECTVAAVAGAALTDDTDLYAKWTVHSASECITIAYFETTAHNNSSSKPDNAGKYIYGYTNSAKTEAYAYTITSSTGDNKGQGTGESDYLRMNYGTTVTIYADNTTTGGTPATFSNVTSVSVDFKMKSSTYYTSFDIYVGSTKIANNVSLEGAAQSAFTTFTYDNLEQLSGTVRIVNKGSGSSNYHFYVDNIVICTASMSSCTTPTLPTATLSNQTVCEGSDIAAWNATPTNASAITAAGQSIAYSWKKKGNDTELEDNATFDLGASAAESQAGTYVVTVTVSKAGYASASASKEVDLSVTEGTEAPTVTQSTTPVYKGNSVTLTATATTGATYTWHTCNADGTGESSAISGATTNAYAIASAPAAGTHYYKVKVTGDGTHTCGNAETVYALTVSEAAGGDCETEFWFAKAADKPEGATAATHISGTPSGSSSASYTATIDGNNYTITGQTGQKTGNVTITVPENYEGTLYVVVQGSSSRTITLSKGGVQVGQETPANSTWGTFTFSDLDAGTYTLVSSGNIGWGILALKLCSASACYDPEVTASVNNTTACAGTSVTFTATGAHASATYQWQKLDGTWTDISDETASTYTIASVVAGDAGKYRVIASHDCNRTSNEVTLSVPSAPDFGSTVPASVSVMQTIALSINTVEATDAVKYRWYKSADDTWDAGDVEIGTNKELIKAYDSEAIGSPSYYIFCRAQNACGITTSTAIAVNVTAYVEEDCATRGNETDAEFGFQNSGCGQGTYNSASCWTMNSNSKILIYSAPDGKYFKTMKVTIASSSASKASYNWSIDGGSSYTADGVAITGVTTTLTEKTINLSAHGNVNEVKIGRNFGKGESGGTLYVSKICFEYTDACTATTVTPSTSSKTYEMDGSSFTEPTFTVKHGGTAFDPQPTLTYSSSNEDIASVDDDGTVTFNGEAGTVTITASYAGGTISATDYCASSGSYTITVSCTGGAPKIVADGSTDMENCNSSVTLLAKTQSDGDFADGTYQWFRNGTEIDGATSSSYTATQAGTYTVERTNTSDCTTPSTNSAIVTSETTEPEVERLVPFQYYHVNKTYSDQMKMRHLFAVKNSGKLDGKSFKMYVSRNGGVATDVTSSNALVVWPSADGHVDTVMVDLNKLSGKYSEDDELVFTCKAIDCESNVSDVYKNTITMNVIGATPTLALICSGSSKAGGTRKTGELTVGGDFLTGYNVADLCQQTGNTSFDGNTEWGLYTNLKTQYIVTPVNGYAVFNKLNYEPFDILLLTDYPKASKSDAAADVLDDMAALCDYRPMLSFKTHMVAKSPSKWAEKGFTTSPVVTKADGRLNLNIVCYAHPMFEHLKDGANVYRDADNSSELVYTMLTGEGYEGSKGMQGFEIDAAENFVTIGLTHYNASAAPNTPSTGNLRWTPGSGDRMLVTVAERQANIEARFILFSINCGAQSKLTPKGEEVILACLEYLLDADPLHVADCSFTFDNGANAPHDKDWYKVPANCPGCTGELGDGKWSTQANWGPDRINLPGEFTSARIAAPVTVDMEHAKAMELRIINEGSIDIPAGKALDVKSTIRRMDGSEIYPTEESDIHIGSGASGNGTLIFNNNSGDTKARVDMYSNAQADMENMSAATSTWQYIGTPHNDVASATRNYYNSWLYQYSGSGWEVIPNGGPLVPFRGYCVTHPDAPVVFDMEGTLVATTAQDIAIPAGYTVIANSWTAPIDISTFTDDDMENISDKTIYFFNTGSDAEGTAGTGTEAGTYVAVPKNSASYVETWQIPSMQGFYISTETAGTLHLDYDRHVRPHNARTVVSSPMYAPKRAAAESDEPNVLKIFARGSRYQDKLVVLEREDFTRGYDSGWDGEAWGGGTLSPMVYVTGEGREDAVSAIPEFEGTVVAFKAGEDSEYRFEFIYDGDESLYLFDTENNTYTQIMTGNAYYFTTTDKAAHSRFILTRKAPQVATGVGEVPSDQVLSTKAKKLIIEDKMYILLNGMLYDATGKVVFK